MKKVWVFAALLLLAALATGVAERAAAQAVSSDSLIIHLKSGERVAIPISSIQKITFDSATAGVMSTSENYSGLQLSPNYPNPSRVGTSIEFTIPFAGNVSVAIFDSKGNLVRRLELSNSRAGENTVQWDGRDDHGTTVPSGLYFYEVRFGNEFQTRQIVVEK